MRVVAVPVKALPRSKGRLASILTPGERAAVTLAMLDDVVRACLGHPGWETWVVSPDESVLRAAASLGARPMAEQRGSLLGAVHQVEVEARGAEALAIVLGDLPWLRTEDVHAALDPIGPVVAAPAASDGGTNLLLRRPPEAIAARFGRSSFDRHRLEASRQGLDMAEIRTPGLERDVDRPEDLAWLVATGHRCRTLSVCLEMGLPVLEPVRGD
jgi:2-phospho-L-lactate guanylyltransferase